MAVTTVTHCAIAIPIIVMIDSVRQIWHNALGLTSGGRQSIAASRLIPRAAAVGSSPVSLRRYSSNIS
jgi:hypothetical protein